MSLGAQRAAAVRDWPKVAWLLAAIVAVAAIAAWASLTLARPAPANVIAGSGTIEATQSDVASKTQGRLLRLLVNDGDTVRKGQLLAELERVTPAANLDQAGAAVQAASAQLSAAQAAYALQSRAYHAQLAGANAAVTAAQSAVGQAGVNLHIERRAADVRVDQAAAQEEAAQAAFGRAATELRRERSLTGTGDEPQRALDDASLQYRSAAAQLQSAQAALALAQADRRNVLIRRLTLEASQSQAEQSVAAAQLAAAQSSAVDQRRSEVLAARAQLSQARAALRLAQEQVAETQIVAPFDGTVASHNFEAGDLVSPGAPVLTIADLRHPYINVYVAETELPRVHAGQAADVRIDGLPDKTFHGTVTEIASGAEFTPENVQTQAQRIEYLVFRVKIQLNDSTGTLRPGLPADAEIHV